MIEIVRGKLYYNSKTNKYFSEDETLSMHVEQFMYLYVHLIGVDEQEDLENAYDFIRARIPSFKYHTIDELYSDIKIKILEVTNA